ncbi:MAG: RluA family pseudouridine synthase [Gammaproteobacteria bacterium]|nr:RluA family pseudouridine synthase [Gammaproteobacteria bacterium]
MAFKAVQVIEIEAGDDGQRIDNFLFRLLKGVPKSRVYRLLRKGEVRVNGGRARPSRRLQAGDSLRIPPVRQGDPAAAVGPSRSMIETIGESIIYEDNEMLVLNKPAGMAVHGGSGINAGVIEALRQLRPDARRLELVHRLDRGTSGCLMVAKTRAALVRLQAALRHKSGIAKTYWALVHGEWLAARTEVALPLVRRELEGGGRIVRVADSGADSGKEALTRFRVQKASKRFSWLEAQPVTGRTHQIRVHCSVAGHPIVGDDKYGHEKRDAALGARRLMLHAARLVITRVEGPPIVVDAPLDSEFLQLKKYYLSDSQDACS